MVVVVVAAVVVEVVLVGVEVGSTEEDISSIKRQSSIARGRNAEGMSECICQLVLLFFLPP